MRRRRRRKHLIPVTVGGEWDMEDIEKMSKACKEEIASKQNKRVYDECYDAGWRAAKKDTRAHDMVNYAVLIERHDEADRKLDKHREVIEADWADCKIHRVIQSVAFVVMAVSLIVLVFIKG
jgi:hypothetical protein